MSKYEFFIQRCFDLARLAAGKVSPNPMVGAVIVVEEKIVSEGFHAFSGGAHAEINAIKNLRDKALLQKATLYISLEPCFHFGKTPPCVDAIIKYKIPKVVISSKDPNSKTKGKSVQKLRKAGVEVIEHILTSKGKQIAYDFFSSHERKRPYVITKYARSINHKMGVHNQNIWISNPITKRLTHKWRSELSAIMVGTNTILTDDPKLDNRLYYGNSPLKLLLKRDASLSPTLAAFATKGKTVVISEPNAKRLTLPNVSQWFFNFDENLIRNILKRLLEEGHNSLLVEGGARLIQYFYAQNLWDEARVFVSNKSILAVNAIEAPLPEGILDSKYCIGNNTLVVYKNPSAYV